MPIPPTTLKHKPVFYRWRIMRMWMAGWPITAERQRGFPWVWPGGMTGAGWIFRPRCGGVPGRNGPTPIRRDCPAPGAGSGHFGVPGQTVSAGRVPAAPDFYDPENPMVDRIGIQGDAMTLQVCTENQHIPGGYWAVFGTRWPEDDELIGERLRVLKPYSEGDGLLMDQERRRTLRRQYREAPREGGIICMQNRETGQRFLLAEPQPIGSAEQISVCDSDRIGCCYAALQKDWAAYGTSQGIALRCSETLRPQEGQTPKEFREGSEPALSAMAAAGELKT